MRPRYGTPAIVLSRSGTAEASASLLLLTEEFGLARARAQGVRKPGAKLASAVQTLSECDVILVKGKDGWRLSGASLVRNRSRELTRSMRARAGRVATLILRLVHGETNDPALFTLFSSFLDVLPTLSEEDGDAAETLTVLRMLGMLGLAESVPYEDYSPEALKDFQENRRTYILLVNKGIGASGL